MSNKRPLKAYVRFDGSGRAVSSSLIWRKNKPKVGKWKEIVGYECCDGGGGGCNPNERYQTSFTLPGTASNVGGQTVLFIVCDNNLATGLAFTGWALPAETYSIQTYIDILNGSISPNIATFSWGGGTTVNVEITSCLKDLFCPNGELLISYPPVPP